MRKNYFYEIIFSRVALVIFVVMLFLIAGLAKQPPISLRQSSNTASLILPNGTTISAELADTQAERAQGLSGRQSLPEDHAMLFVFDRSGEYSFWMPDMNFAIDIIWMDENYQIVDVATNVQPDPGTIKSELSRYTNKIPARYVLEARAGFFSKHQLDRGDVIQLT